MIPLAAILKFASIPFVKVAGAIALAAALVSAGYFTGRLHEARSVAQQSAADVAAMKDKQIESLIDQVFEDRAIEREYLATTKSINEKFNALDISNDTDGCLFTDTDSLREFNKALGYSDNELSGTAGTTPSRPGPAPSPDPNQSVNLGYQRRE